VVDRPAREHEGPAPEHRPGIAPHHEHFQARLRVAHQEHGRGRTNPDSHLSMYQVTERVRPSRRLTAARRPARTGGSRSSRPTASGMTPGVSIRAPAKRMSEPAKGSRPSTNRES